MEEEIWKDISGYDGLYQVSSFGRIKSLERKVYIPAYGGQYRHLKEAFLEILNSSVGYYKITLSKNSKQKQFWIHRLVAIAFIPNPNNYPVINHIDGCKTNNSISNLEWCTQKHNIIHSWNSGMSSAYWTGKGGKGNPLNKGIVRFDRNGEKIDEFESLKIAQEKTGVHRSSISSCASGRLLSAGGFRWCYKSWLI